MLYMIIIVYIINTCYDLMQYNYRCRYKLISLSHIYSRECLEYRQANLARKGILAKGERSSYIFKVRALTTHICIYIYIRVYIYIYT